MARIVRIQEYGDPSVLKIEDIEVPPLLQVDRIGRLLVFGHRFFKGGQNFGEQHPRPG